MLWTYRPHDQYTFVEHKKLKSSFGTNAFECRTWVGMPDESIRFHEIINSKWNISSITLETTASKVS